MVFGLDKAQAAISLPVPALLTFLKNGAQAVLEPVLTLVEEVVPVVVMVDLITASSSILTLDMTVKILTLIPMLDFLESKLSEEVPEVSASKVLWLTVMPVPKLLSALNIAAVALALIPCLMSTWEVLLWSVILRVVRLSLDMLVS
jgi:hypothetical protein